MLKNKKRSIRKRTTRRESFVNSNDELVIIASDLDESESKPTAKRRSTRERKLKTESFVSYFETNDSDDEIEIKEVEREEKEEQLFPQLFDDEEDEENDEDEDKNENEEDNDVFQLAMMESIRLQEIAKQNEAHEAAILRDSILQIEEEERNATRTRIQAAANRVFVQDLSSDAQQVSIRVVLPSCEITKTWLVNTPFLTVLQWISTEMIKQGVDVLEDEIRLSERTSPQVTKCYDPDFSLDMNGITEPTVFIAQYSSLNLHDNKKTRIS